MAKYIIYSYKYRKIPSTTPVVLLTGFDQDRWGAILCMGGGEREAGVVCEGE